MDEQDVVKEMENLEEEIFSLQDRIDLLVSEKKFNEVKEVAKKLEKLTKTLALLKNKLT